jgi:hypothetical protein
MAQIAPFGAAKFISIQASLWMEYSFAKLISFAQLSELTDENDVVAGHATIESQVFTVT